MNDLLALGTQIPVKRVEDQNFLRIVWIAGAHTRDGITGFLRLTIGLKGELTPLIADLLENRRWCRPFDPKSQSRWIGPSCLDDVFVVDEPIIGEFVTAGCIESPECLLLDLHSALPGRIGDLINRAKIVVTLTVEECTSS